MTRFSGRLNGLSPPKAGFQASRSTLAVTHIFPTRRAFTRKKKRSCRRHGARIAQRFIAGDTGRRTVRVPEGRLNGTQPSLRDFVAWASALPALKRWAIVNRPSGTSLAGIPKGALLVGNSKRFTAGSASTPTASVQPVSTGFPIRATRQLSVVVLASRLVSADWWHTPGSPVARGYRFTTSGVAGQRDSTRRGSTATPSPGAFNRGGRPA